MTIWIPNRHRVSLRRIVLLASDLVLIAAAFALSPLVRFGIEYGLVFLMREADTLAWAALVFPVVFYATGLYDRQALAPGRSVLMACLSATSISVIIIVLVFYARLQLLVGRGILFIASLLILIGACLTRKAIQSAIRRGVFSRSTLVVGETEAAAEVIHLIHHSPESMYRAMGVVTLHGQDDAEIVDGVPVIGRVDRLRDFVAAYAVETIIVNSSRPHDDRLFRILRPLRYAGIEVLDYLALYERLAQQIPVDRIDDEWLLHAAMNSSVLHVRKVKRIMDFTLAAAGLGLSAPIWIPAALLVGLTSRGGMLYRQTRAGLDGRPYTLYKLRTMVKDAEEETGPVWAEADDQRVTRIGRLLRTTRIDEIPQLWNVLRGDMSLVGPRPERPEFIEALSEQIPFYQERLLVPPGVTGWAQVCYPYAAGVEAAYRKLQYDLYYIKHMGFFLDLIILFRTVRTVLQGVAHSAQEDTLVREGRLIRFERPAAKAGGEER